jgi:hypothetical protein
MNQKVIGWTSCYSGICPVVSFTEDRKRALIERIRKRQYDFNYQDHAFLPYCAPVYGDKSTCELTKQEWDSVMTIAYKDTSRSQRLLPQDAIEDNPVDGILYEKKKFYMEGDQNDG